MDGRSDVCAADVYWLRMCTPYAEVGGNPLEEALVVQGRMYNLSELGWREAGARSAQVEGQVQVQVEGDYWGQTGTEIHHY